MTGVQTCALPISQAEIEDVFRAAFGLQLGGGFEHPPYPGLAVELLLDFARDHEGGLCFVGRLRSTAGEAVGGVG